MIHFKMESLDGFSLKKQQSDKSNPKPAGRYNISTVRQRGGKGPIEI